MQIDESDLQPQNASASIAESRQPDWKTPSEKERNMSGNSPKLTQPCPFVSLASRPRPSNSPMITVDPNAAIRVANIRSVSKIDYFHNI
jgi:hypothetical protein